MFIIDFVWGLMQLAGVAGTGLYVYSDYKRGWATSKRLLGRVANLTLRRTGYGEDSEKKINAVINEYARQVASFREDVASIEADAKVYENKAREQEAEAHQYWGLVEGAFRCGDQEAAAIAAEAQVQAETRRNLFTEHASDQARVVRVMRLELDNLEMSFEQKKTKAETARVRLRKAQAKRRLYELSSEVHEKYGLTPSGELDKIFLDAEREDIKTGVLLEMVREGPRLRAGQLLHSVEVERVLEEARQRLALPPASDPAGAMEEEATVIDEKRIMVVSS